MGWTNSNAIQDEPCRDAEAAGSPTASDPLTIHSEVPLKPNAATTPRVSGDLIADAGQQRLGSHSSSSNSDNEEEPGRGLVRTRHRKLQNGSKRRIRKYLEMALEKQQEASLLAVLSLVLREDYAADSALVIFLNHRFLLGLQAS